MQKSDEELKNENLETIFFFNLSHLSVIRYFSHWCDLAAPTFRLFPLTHLTCGQIFIKLEHYGWLQYFDDVTQLKRSKNYLPSQKMSLNTLILILYHPKYIDLIQAEVGPAKCPPDFNHG